MADPLATGMPRRPSRRSLGKLTFSISLLSALLACSPRAGTAEKPAPASPQTNAPSAAVIDPAASFFAGPILKLKIELSKSEFDKLNRDNRHYVKGTVTEGNQVYKDVGVHLKGAAGSFRPLDQNPALTLKFDQFVRKQEFHGLDKIHLNNSVQDPTFITEILCGEMFRQAGVPAARATHSRIQLNGRDLGFYVLKEGFDKAFLRQYFHNVNGNLYDGGFLRDINDNLQKRTLPGVDPEDRRDLKKLASASADPNLQSRWTRLQQVLDVERFLSLTALDIMMWDWDGYPMKHNNYRVYHDPESDRIVFFPHGMDQMFWDPGGSIFPNMEGLVARQLLQIPEARARYVERVGELLTNVFQVKWMTNRLAALTARIQPELKAINPGLAQNHLGAVQVLRDRIIQRGANLSQQIAALPRPVNFAADGTVRLNTGWRAQADAGSPTIEQTQLEGKQILRIAAAPNQASAGSWRRRVALPPGRYELRATVKTTGVAALPDPKGIGAGLRVSGQSRRNQSLGDSAWKNVACEFEVPSGAGDPELICELRATKGEAWFDLENILVRRR